ncbi:hypothetical protein M2134_003240, partial [Parabacteroides sp. PM6-13]|nr:hypothetical protein [Parabacteroides sp. PM6-13]
MKLLGSQPSTRSRISSIVIFFLSFFLLIGCTDATDPKEEEPV